jgi:hypothetical protein
VKNLSENQESVTESVDKDIQVRIDPEKTQERRRPIWQKFISETVHFLKPPIHELLNDPKSHENQKMVEMALSHGDLDRSTTFVSKI